MEIERQDKLVDLMLDCCRCDSLGLPGAHGLLVLFIEAIDEKRKLEQ